MSGHPGRRGARALLDLVRRARARLTRSPHHRVDLSDRSLYRRLVAGSSSRIDAALADAREGRLDEARRSVVSHFVQRQDPRFFIDIDAVPAACEWMRRHRSPWVDDLVARVNDEMKNGLRLVTRRHDPLGGPFRWEGIERGPGDDTLYSAQPHRFGFLPRLALAAHHGLDTLPAIATLMSGWMRAAEAGEPECYHSPLAVLYRVLATSWTFAIVAAVPRAGAPRDRILFDLLKILAADVEYLVPTIGTSYPNNHLLADGFAGWYVGMLYPELAGAAEARRAGEPVLVREVQRQFLADGSSFEHSTHYHELGCEMVGAYMLLCRRNGLPPDAGVSERLRAMLRFQAALNGPQCSPLRMGDCTEDPLFPLDVEHGWAPGAMRELFRALVEPGWPAAPVSCRSAERAFWLLGGAFHGEPKGKAAEPWRSHFPAGGIHVLGDPEARARLVFRTGPVQGQPISAGHAHADLLSVHVDVDGVPFVVGAGTGTYRLHADHREHGVAQPRRYFAGPLAHNGICGLGDPLGEMSGDFRNRDIDVRVRAEVLVDSAEWVWIEGEIVGGGPYHGWRRGVVHDVGFGWWVYDIGPAGPGDPEVSIGLQFDPLATVALDSDARQLDAAAAGARCRIVLGDGLGPALIHTGSENPPAGWVSPSYGVQVAAPQLRAARAAGARLTAFLIAAQGPGTDPPTRIAVRRVQPGGEIELSARCAHGFRGCVLRPGHAGLEAGVARLRAAA